MTNLESSAQDCAFPSPKRLLFHLGTGGVLVGGMSIEPAEVGPQSVLQVAQRVYSAHELVHPWRGVKHVVRSPERHTSKLQQCVGLQRDRAGWAPLDGHR